jgi:integrase/recombinase XerD
VDELTVKILSEMQRFAEGLGQSPATIGINMRNLRAAFRRAISEGSVHGDAYPFGKGKYQIPTGSKVNKALTEEDLKTLWYFEPKNAEQSFAKDLWFFSYYAYGMNTRDMCELRHDSVKKKSFTYVRAKTKNTRKDRTIKEVPITESMRQIIKRRKDKSSPFLFGLINENDSATERHNKIKGVNRRINYHFRALAKLAGIDDELVSSLGTYHARHSFATISVRKGKSIALISEILHDGNIHTTQSYINSFSKEAYDELSNDLEL